MLVTAEILERLRKIEDRLAKLEVRGLASGGVVTPQPYLVGAHGIEVFIPRGDGEPIPSDGPQSETKCPSP